MPQQGLYERNADYTLFEALSLMSQSCSILIGSNFSQNVLPPTQMDKINDGPIYDEFDFRNKNNLWSRIKYEINCENMKLGSTQYRNLQT